MHLLKYQCYGKLKQINTSLEATPTLLSNINSNTFKKPLVKKKQNKTYFTSTHIQLKPFLNKKKRM